MKKDEMKAMITAIIEDILKDERKVTSKDILKDGKQATRKVIITDMMSFGILIKATVVEPNISMHMPARVGQIILSNQNIL
jgi:hypothetical protein